VKPYFIAFFLSIRCFLYVMIKQWNILVVQHVNRLPIVLKSNYEILHSFTYIHVSKFLNINNFLTGLQLIFGTLSDILNGSREYYHEHHMNHDGANATAYATHLCVAVILQINSLWKKVTRLHNCEQWDLIMRMLSINSICMSSSFSFWTFFLATIISILHICCNLFISNLQFIFRFNIIKRFVTIQLMKLKIKSKNK